MENKTVNTKPYLNLKIGAALLLGITGLILGIIYFDKILGLLPKNENDENQPREITLEEYRKDCTEKFTDIETALANPENVCIIDLSNQNLASISAEIGKLPKLHTLILTGNEISEENKTEINEAMSKRNPQVGYDIQF